MGSRKVRFLHAGDMRLEQMVQGVAECPSHLREILRDAAYLAAAQVFDLAVREQVDFLVLTGRMVDGAQAGLRGVLFAAEQFQRLADRRITVYCTPDAVVNWPGDFPFPLNVERLSSVAGRSLFCRHGEPVAQIIGGGGEPTAAVIGGENKPQIDVAGLIALRTHDLPAVALAVGETSAEQVRKTPIDYWALGGRTRPAELCNGATVAWYAGSPQGRTVDEVDPHGCLLVEIDDDGSVYTRFTATDVVRFAQHSVKLKPHDDLKNLENHLRHHLDRLLEDDASQGQAPADWLIAWTVSGDGPLVTRLRRTAASGELLERLRTEYGHGRPSLWSLRLDCDPTARLTAERFDEPTILGDYLRALGRRFEDRNVLDRGVNDRKTSGDKGLERSAEKSTGERRLTGGQAASATQTPERTQERSQERSSGEREPGPKWHPAELLGPATAGRPRPELTWDDPTEQDRVLREAAALGLDLLGGLDLAEDEEARS